METVIIFQPAGIGDIFYCLKIAYYISFFDKNVKTIEWPVIDEFSYIKDYIKIPKLKFTSFNDFVDQDDKKQILNLRDADVGKPQYDNNTMQAKYDLANIDSSDALDYFDFFRNYEREEKLYNELNPNNEEYILRSCNVGSPPQYSARQINIETNKKIIDVKVLPNYNLFDWCKVLENASEIYMVDTSFMYLMEKLDLKASKFKLYSRFNPANFNVIKHIPKNVKWELTEW